MTRGRKKSTFIQDKSVPNDHFFDTFGKGVNRKISKPDLFNQIRANAQTYIYQTQAEVEKLNLQANPDNPVYFRVSENDFKLYEITTLEPGPDDFSLDNGTTATHIVGFVPDAEDIPADSPDDNVQAGLRNRVTALPDITALSSLNTAALVDGQQFSVGSYLPDTSTGSCLLRWRPDLPKSRHDGVLFFSLTVPMFTGTNTADYRNGVGETDSGGNGVMELVRGEIIYDATVLIPGYYSTAQSALDDLSGRIRIAQGVEVGLLHESGHQPEIGVSVSKGNYSAYVITSQDATIIVGNGFSGHFITATDGAHAPTLGALVDGNSLVSRGLNLFNGAQALVLEGCGVVAYTEAGIWCYAGSNCQASNANFSNGSGIAIRASQRSNIVAPGIDVSGNTSSLYTVYINRASSAHLQQINLSQCDAPVALRAHRTAQVHAAYAFSDSCNDFAIASATSTLSIQGAFVTGIRGQAVLAHRASLVTMYDDDTVHGADSARFVAASGNDSVGVRGTDASSVDGRGCKISGFGIDNINLADSCSGQFRGAVIEDAGRDGVSCNNVSTISVGGGSVTGSSRHDLSVTNGGQISASGTSTTLSEGSPSIDDCNIGTFDAISSSAGIIWD